jgi:hypothetical protein
VGKGGRFVVLKVRREQLIALERSVKDDFEDSMVAYALNNWHAFYSDRSEASVRARVRRALGAAAAYGLSGEHAWTSFIEATFVLGEEFMNQPSWTYLKLILENKSVSSTQKADRLKGAIRREMLRRDLLTGAAEL